MLTTYFFNGIYKAILGTVSHRTFLLHAFFLFLSLFFFSCQTSPTTTKKATSPYDHPNCYFLEDGEEEISIEGFLFLDSKQNIFLEFEDSLFNGKLKLLSDPEMCASIHRAYDSYLVFKNPEDGPFRVDIYGHYMEVGVTEWPWPHRRREFYVHQISFLGE